MQDIIRLSATRQAALIRSKQISSREVVSEHLLQIERFNPAINAVIEVFAEEALIAADLADSAAVRGPLHGVPISIKDSIEIKGKVCTAGTLGRKNAKPATADAELVARLRRAGAIPIARTNLPDLLFSFETDNLLFGRTNNPYDVTRTPGGSSGGESALIAVCGSACGLGSDAAGSVRVPAASCGIASIKPTSGRLPRTGHYPAAGGWIETLWQIGPMARWVEDLITMMPLLAGADGRDATVVSMPVLDPQAVNVRELRIACYGNDPLIHRIAAHFPGTEAFRPACFDDAYDLEMKLLGADGGDSLRSFLSDIGSEQVHPLLTGWLDKLEAYRTDVRGLQKYWAQLDAFRREMASMLLLYDAVICPVHPKDALPHGTSILDENFRGFAHTMIYNLTGWPAAVVRGGTSAEGLPVGVQIAAAPWREDIALAVASAIEQISGGWQPPALISAG
jgi:amidase